MAKLKVASPCPMLWDRLDKTEERGVRFCRECRKNVYNLIEISEADLNNLLTGATAGDSLCLRLYQRADGTVITNDCPVGLKKVREFWQRMKTGAVASLAFLISSTPAALGQNKDGSATCKSKTSKSTSFKLTGSASHNAYNVDSAYIIKQPIKLNGSSQRSRSVSSIMGGVSKPPTLDELRPPADYIGSQVWPALDSQNANQSGTANTSWTNKPNNRPGEKAMLVRLRIKQASRIEAQGDDRTARAVLDQAQIEADQLENRYDLQQEVLQARLSLAKKMGKNWLGPMPVSSPVNARKL